jgi:hypothetical protein
MVSWFVTFENSATEECANIKLYVLQYKDPSETLQMLEEAYGKVAVKKMQVYG